MVELERRLFLAGLGAATLPLGIARAAGGPIVAKIMVEDGRLLVGATIGNSEPLIFIIDTGASINVLRPDVARQLNLTMLGGASIRGVANKQATAGVVEAKDVLIAGVMRQPVMNFSTYDLGRLASDAAGLFASGLLTAYDSDLNFSGGTWQIWPKGRDGQPTGTRLDGASITTLGAPRGTERIYVTVMIDGQPYKLMVDTGAPRSIILFPRASGRSGLRTGRPSSPLLTRGIGGAADKLSHTVRATRFEMGPLAFDRPFVTLMDPDQSSGANYDGLLGLPLIKMLDWSTDVGSSRLWVTRNTSGLVADRYSKSGLWLDRTATGGAVVANVGTGSPAAAAGIRAGDAVVEPARFADALVRINGPVRQAFSLTIRRGTDATTHNIVPTFYL